METRQDTETQEPVSFNYFLESITLELKELDTVTQEPVFLKRVVETTIQTKTTETQEVAIQIETVETQEKETHIIHFQT